MGHLTAEERIKIECLYNSGVKQNRIAELLTRDKSVISREISRNSDKRNGSYKASLADRKSKKRQKEKLKHISYTNEVKSNVKELITLDYSPEQVSNTLKKQGKNSVSHERIYQSIWEDKKNGGSLYLHLRNNGRKYRKRGGQKDNRGIIKNRVSIDNRPSLVEKRERFGDLEVDLIIGKNHKQAILTINDRASGMLKMMKVESKEATVVTAAINNALEDWKPYIYTITADNGKEFAGHETVAEALDIDYYFAQPYHPWERGSNENLNGLIRQYFKKGSDFINVTESEIKEVENKLNNRPRKRFKYESPIFVMNQLLFNLKVAFVT